MNRKLAVVIGAVLLCTLGAIPAWPQGNTGIVKGQIIEASNKPAVNFQVVFTSLVTGRQFKVNTDDKGFYGTAGLAFVESYKVEVIGPKGDVLHTQKQFGLRGDVTSFNVDLSQPEVNAGDKLPAKPTKEQIKAEAARIASLNALVAQVQAAIQAQKWAEAETALKQLLAANPDTTRWEFYKALGDAQGHSQEYQDAVQAYEKGIPVAEAVATGTAAKDPGNPNPDPARAVLGVSQMLTAQGNAYVKLEKYEEALASFKKAADKSPNPAVAYYNICSLKLNFNQTDAAAYCDKATAADPARADAWFLKGTALYRNGKTDNGKFTAPEGTADALNKYLQLDPNGGYAAQAKSMLQKLGSN